jgi:hypothetical protein
MRVVAIGAGSARTIAAIAGVRLELDVLLYERVAGFARTGGCSDP